MSDDELILRRKKQNADRARAYRKRKKDVDAMPSTSAIQSGEPVSENIVTANLLHQKQLNAERCRRYRQKCKRLKSGANLNRGTSDRGNTVQGEIQVQARNPCWPAIKEEVFDVKHSASSATDASAGPSTSGPSYINECNNPIKLEIFKGSASNHFEQKTFHIDEANYKPPGELDVYDKFAMSLAKKIKSIEDVFGRVRLMYSMQSMVDNFCTNRGSDIPPHAELPEGAAPRGMLELQQLLMNQAVQPMTLPADHKLQIIKQPSTSEENKVAQPVLVHRTANQPISSSTQIREKNKCKTPAKKRKLTDELGVALDTDSYVEVPAKATLPTDFVSFSCPPDATADSVDEASFIDTIEIKQEKIQYDETSSLAVTGLATNDPVRKSTSHVKFVYDPIPIKLEMVHDTHDP